MSAISELSTIRRDKAKTPEEKRRQAKEAGRDNKAGYLFLLPWLIGLVVITIGPMVASLYLSFTNYSLIQAPKWIGTRELHPDARRRTAAQLPAGHLHLRLRVHPAAADRWRWPSPSC